ncbi:hypothetical protein KC845_01840 [Candidatus Kaiserbacteria bacterium]|nr:hypothetical protein [Candidatus Kaiserbacteria bacterium]
MKNSENKVRKTIMRRVYYAYLLRMIGQPLSIQVCLLSLSLLWLTQLISIPAIMHNLLVIPVGRVPGYVWEALTGTEFIVLLVLGVIMMTALSLRVTLRFHKPIATVVG